MSLPTSPFLTRLLAIAALGGLGACAVSEPGTPSAPSPKHTTAAPAGMAGALSAYHWLLDDALDTRGARDARWMPPRTSGGQALRLTFEQQRLSIGGLCNILVGGYQLDGSRIQLLPLAGTMRLCPQQDDVMRYERALAAHLPQAKAWSIAPASPASAAPVLTLTFQDGGQWQFKGSPTDATRYGSAGETRFLEVSPDTVACNHPLTPGLSCLNVREVYYGENGVKRGTGPWQPFYGQIEGYAHQPGVRHVLRIKRYTLPRPPADGSRYAYVFDMAVETEQVGPR